MKHCLIALLCLSVSFPVHAAQWRVEKSKSHLGFSVQWQDHPLKGEFKNWDAQIEFDPNDLEKARAIAKVDVGSVTVGSDEMDEGIRGPLGFDASAFSTATFETIWFRSVGKDRYEARGNLTIRGITRAITLPFKLDMNGDTAHMTGSASLTRTDFHVGMGQWATDNPVSRLVTVNVDLTAVKVK